MAEQQITPGTKLQVAFDVPMGQKTDFNMLATYKENLDEAYFLMSAPMLAGKPLLMDENQKLLLQYKTLKRSSRRLIKVRCSATLRIFQ